MFPKCQWKLFHWKQFIFELNKWQTSPKSTGICENEQVWPKDFSKPLIWQNTGLKVPAIANLRIIFYREDAGMLGGVDMAQIPRI